MTIAPKETRGLTQGTGWDPVYVALVLDYPFLIEHAAGSHPFDEAFRQQRNFQEKP